MDNAARTATTYKQWAFSFGATIQAYWLLSSVFWVVGADLSPTELILLGTVLEASVLIAEIPTGVVADALSRKWSVVISMVIMGIGFFFTGLAREFWVIVVTQMVWGVGWTFSSGADTAWITDELFHDGQDQAYVDQVLAAKARFGQLGAAAGLLTGGLLAWATSLSTVISITGVLMVGLGIFVALRFTESGFQRADSGHLQEARRILSAGVRLARLNRTVLMILLVTVVFNMGAEAVDRLTTKRLIDLGVPPGAEEIAWFTLFGVVALLAGSVALRWVENRIEGVGAPRRLFVSAALVATAGTVLVAMAPNFGTGVTGDIVVRGLAWATLPVVAEVWVNRHAASDVRATIQSFLGQAESIGQILGGVALAYVASQAGIRGALMVSAALFATSAALVWWVSPGTEPTPSR